MIGIIILLNAFNVYKLYFTDLPIGQEFPQREHFCFYFWLQEVAKNRLKTNIFLQQQFCFWRKQNTAFSLYSITKEPAKDCLFARSCCGIDLSPLPFVCQPLLPLLALNMHEIAFDCDRHHFSFFFYLWSDCQNFSLDFFLLALECRKRHAFNFDLFPLPFVSAIASI